MALLCSLSVVESSTVTAFSPNSTSLVFTWEHPPVADNYIITLEYVTENQQLACVGYEYNHTATVDVNAAEFVLAGLQEYTVYRFSVVAVFNRHGIEIQSDSTVGNITTLQAGIRRHCTEYLIIVCLHVSS